MSLEVEVPLYEFRVNRFFEYDHDEIMAARELALQAPLHTGLQLTLALEIPPQNPAPNARRVPVVPGSTGGPTVVQLRDELQKGIDWFSQVWTAAVCVSDGPDSETCLVLKIIQPSMCRGPPAHPFDEYYEPWDLAHNEAWVYRHLAHQQGLLIPYFFGLSTIVTPCGEESWVLVLEFIPGLTVSSFTDPASIPNIRDFCALGVTAVLEFIRATGWSLRDPRPPNFILTRTPGGARAVVIIDLFLSEPLPLKSIGTDRESIAILGAREFLFKLIDWVYTVDGGLRGWAKAEERVPGCVWVYPPPGPDGDDGEEGKEEEERGVGTEVGVGEEDMA